jgi:hypothetical protein
MKPIKFNKLYTTEQIIKKISHGECLECNGSIDKSFNYTYRWRVPLCKKCRMLYLNKETKKILHFEQ